jgi:GNAT superfamily N-acetyltransferase
MRYLEQAPPPEGYANLRAAVGWDALAPEAVETGLRNALYSVAVYDGDQLIGCGRVVGDGGLYFYLQDIIVLPEYQGRGVGHGIMKRVMGYLEENARKNAFVGLMAAVGVKDFYHRYGFRRRPDDRPGMFRIWT